jgi:transglutaminase-like putative cysteine protease
VLVRTQVANWQSEVRWEEAAVGIQTQFSADPSALTEYRLASPHVPLVGAAVDYARRSFTPRRRLVEALRDLTQRIRAEFVYDPLATTIATPIAEVATRRRGVCQDFAHFMLSGLRGLGLAARYMSGYIVNERTTPATSLRGADTSHAWLAVHCPDSDWIGCDPTNGKLADLEFITLGWGRDFGDVTPLRGVVLGAGTRPPKVAVQVTRL